jgi:hypothetical protein
MKEKLIQHIRQMQNPRYMDTAWPQEQTPELNPAPTPGSGGAFGQQEDIASGIDMPDMGESTALSKAPFQVDQPAGAEMDKRALMQQKIRNRLGENRNAVSQ